MNTQWMRAAEQGDLETMRDVLLGGVDLNMQDANGRTAMMAAAYNNQIAAFEWLVNEGADVNIRDNRLDNPFLYAGAEGLIEILKLSIKAGADTRMTNRFGGTALIPAADRGHVEIAKLLLTTTDVNVNHVNNLGWTALIEAVILGDGGPKHQQIVKLLLEHGADPNITDNDGVTPLSHAALRGYGEMIAMLS
ncbi:ankyrin repeat domain-containing protein [Cohnella sp. NL03-T5]|uniref:Ankyrin repeat domain-containing protein n=2 Tax=Cohnella silvisoli TaxID=2873699 RepID=A0ABV1KN55_9BACL|nr:ankyrin repeat domain-containing protein [Cohnella silvisoli]